VKRRQLAATGGSCLLAGVAGCSGIDSPVLSGRHLFADETVAVRVADEGTTDHDVEANAREALAFWASESTEYVGFGIDFEIVDADAEMAIEYVDTPDRCSSVENYSEDVLGCAPLIQSGQRYNGTPTAIVIAGSRPYGQILTTTKHEIGHILGLGHDDQPAEIMSNRPEDRIPLYAERVAIWERTVAGTDAAATATERFNAGIDAWNDDRYDDSAETFRDAADVFRTASEEFATAREETGIFEEFPQPETIELETLQTTLDRLQQRMALAVDFSGLMGEAADAAADGNATEANARRREANGTIREYNEIGAIEVREAAVALGLVRGFDREETVGGDEETV